MGRKTVTFPRDIERLIEAEARRRGMSFSATVVELLERITGEDRPLPYEGVAEGEPSDSMRVEELLDEVVGEEHE